MRIKRQFILAFLLTLLCSFTEGRAQTMRFVASDGHKLWVVDGAEAIQLGDCSGAVWGSPLQLLESMEEGDKGSDELTSKAKDVLRLLQGISKESFKPVPLKQTGIKQAIKDKGTGEDIILSPKLFPPHVRAFFERAESDPSSMIFIMSSGYTFVDDDNQRKYKELSRYIVRVQGSNPTIGEILEGAKKEPVSENLKHIIPYYFLVKPETQEALDVKKTAADYHLKHGAVLWVKSSMR